MYCHKYKACWSDQVYAMDVQQMTGLSSSLATYDSACLPQHVAFTIQSHYYCTKEQSNRFANSIVISTCM